MEKKHQCRQCNQMLDEKFYYKDDRTATGLKGICKHCLRENYLANREKRIKYQTQWNYENADKVREYQDRYRDRQGCQVKINYYQEKISVNA